MFVICDVIIDIKLVYVFERIVFKIWVYLLDVKICFKKVYYFMIIFNDFI